MTMDGRRHTSEADDREPADGELAGLTGHYTVVATREHCDAEDTPETCETLVSYTLTYRLPAA